MTEIGSSGSSAQVVNLKTSTTRSPGSDSVERGTTKATATPTEGTIVQPTGSGSDGVVPQLAKDPFEQAAEVLEDFIPEVEQIPNTRLRIDKDDETGRFVYYSVDDESGEVIRQFPPENILKFLSYYRGLEGLLLDDTI